MANEPRKASEVLLELEVKVDSLINLIKAQSFANQLLSNKINDLMQNLTKQQQSAPPQIRAEAVNTLPRTPISPLHTFQPLDPERQIPIQAETKLPETSEPHGFRRTSRPESFAGDDAYLGQQGPGAPVKMPVQMPKGPPPGRGPEAEVVVPKQAPKQQAQPQSTQQPLPKQSIIQNAVPVIQRAVNADGKPLFLADVEIIDMNTSQPVSKTRTNGTGKWMASLGVGTYRVTIRKKGGTNSGKMEAIQDIQVDGSQSPLELKTIIIK